MYKHFKDISASDGLWNRSPCPSKNIFLGPSVDALRPNFWRLFPESVKSYRTNSTGDSEKDSEEPRNNLASPLFCFVIC